MHKATLFILLFGLATAFAVHAQNDDSFTTITADDLREAGMTDAVAVMPEPTRFHEPVMYFRVARSDMPARKDCDDCHDLVAIYIGETMTVPTWSDDASVRSIGSRFQHRQYLPERGRVIIITAPDREATLRLADILAIRYGT